MLFLRGVRPAPVTNRSRRLTLNTFDTLRLPHTRPEYSATSRPPRRGAQATRTPHRHSAACPCTHGKDDIGPQPRVAHSVRHYMEMDPRLSDACCRTPSAVAHPALSTLDLASFRHPHADRTARPGSDMIQPPSCVPRAMGFTEQQRSHACAP